MLSVLPPGATAPWLPDESHGIALRNGGRAMPSQQPEGERPLSNAERQARYRARRDAQQAASVIRYRRPTDRRTRVQRWHDTVAGLISLKAEYDAWHEALPDSLRAPARPCRPSSTWISTNWSALNRHAASAAIDRLWTEEAHPAPSGKMRREALVPLDELQGKMRRNNCQWQQPTMTRAARRRPLRPTRAGVHDHRNRCS